MIDEKASAYAKEHAGDGDILKVYEAYKDGYWQGDSDSVTTGTILILVIVGGLLGFCIAYLLFDTKIINLT